jgi:hypothetical protein
MKSFRIAEEADGAIGVYLEQFPGTGFSPGKRPRTSLTRWPGWTIWKPAL